MKVWLDPLLENSKQLEFNIHKLYKDLSKNEIDILWNGKGPLKELISFLNISKEKVIKFNTELFHLDIREN